MILEKIDQDLLKMAEESEPILAEIYQRIDDVCLHNSNRILSAFIENQVSYSDFADINGYGNYDEGRDMHIPQELRIRSRGTERHSASN